VPAESVRPRSFVFAVVLPSALALLATMCSATPPAVSPAPATSAPAAEVDATVPGWTVPGVAIANPRTVILLQPPPVAPASSSIRAIAPDPPPLLERGQWVYELGYEKGDVFLRGIHRVDLPAPQATPRLMGRFALELYSGPTLIERVRFDFPGLGGAERGAASLDGGARPLHAATFSFTAKLTTRVGVMLPATTRGTRLELWDRASDRRWPLPWPAVEMTAEVGPAVDAGP
jgi:hypothetical protein